MLSFVVMSYPTLGQFLDHSMNKWIYFILSPSLMDKSSEYRLLYPSKLFCPQLLQEKSLAKLNIFSFKLSESSHITFSTNE